MRSIFNQNHIIWIGMRQLHGQGQPENADEGTARDTAHQGCPEMVALFANVVSFITG